MHTNYKSIHGNGSGSQTENRANEGKIHNRLFNKNVLSVDFSSLLAINTSGGLLDGMYEKPRIAFKSNVIDC